MAGGEVAGSMGPGPWLAGPPLHPEVENLSFWTSETDRIDNSGGSNCLTAGRPGGLRTLLNLFYLNRLKSPWPEMTGGLVFRHLCCRACLGLVEQTLPEGSHSSSPDMASELG